MTTKVQLLRFLYSSCFYCCLPFIIAAKFWRARKAPAYAHGWFERLAYQPLSKTQVNGLWLHAVSLGEVNAALPLIEALLNHYPNLPLTITTTTPTGKQRIQTVLGKRVFYQYLPFDLPGMMRRFLSQLQPKLGIIMESELWPNLCAIAQKQTIPLMLANGRLSPSSQRGYLRCLDLTHAMLRSFAALAVQSELDAERYRVITAYPERIHVTGNLKCQIKLPDTIRAQGETLRASFQAHRPIWIAASTHALEEPQILQAHRQLLHELPHALLILVPRHPERFQDVASYVQAQGFTTSQRSQKNLNADCQIFIGDTMGELLLFYAAADVAFVGGSLAPIGGHNPLEPIALEIPTIMGPEIFNMQALAEQLLDAGAMLTVHDGQQLAKHVHLLLQNKTAKEALVQKASAFLAKQQSVLEQHLHLVHGLLN